MSEISPLAAEWDGVPKNWYSVYQWPRCVAVGHTEEAAGLIEDAFDRIELVTDGLRERFRLPEHRGQVTIAEGTESIVNEKRIVRALYNAKRLPLLGRILDYEAPLRATRDAEHGDVDLISVSRGDCLCLEAKKPGSTESLLKPMLQAYTYARLLWRHRRRFLDEYELDCDRQSKSAAPGAGKVQRWLVGGSLVGASPHGPVLLASSLIGGAAGRP